MWQLHQIQTNGGLKSPFSRNNFKKNPENAPKNARIKQTNKQTRLAPPWDNFWDNCVQKRGSNIFLRAAAPGTLMEHTVVDDCSVLAARLSDWPIHSSIVGLVQNLAVAFRHNPNRPSQLADGDMLNVWSSDCGGSRPLRGLFWFVHLHDLHIFPWGVFSVTVGEHFEK